jgi:hypothetical protein
MSIRRMFQVGVVTLALGGAVAPMFNASEAQTTGTDADRTGTATDDRRGPDFGWIGILGLAGLAGLMGNRREDHTASRTSTASTAR